MSTLQQRRDLVRRYYGFDFPEDFYRFWEFAARLRPLEPLLALHDDLGIVLAGPFDVLYGRCDNAPPPPPLAVHWRYYLDPPEFFTVLVGGGDGHHWGYYLDHPGSDLPPCVASYYADDVFEFAADGNTLFKAVRLWIEEYLGQCVEDNAMGLEYAHDLEEVTAATAGLRAAIQRYETADRPEEGATYVEKYSRKRPRRFRHVVAPTHDGMGVVVPPGAYRSLSISDKALRREVWDNEDPADLVEEARRALRDGYPGTALKLGKELWVNPSDPHQAYAFELLDAAYAALGRDVLREVLRAHRDQRDRPWLDIFHDET